MTRKGVDPEGIAIDSAGRVVLSDADIDQASIDEEVSLAGGSTNITCTNSANCGTSINESSCTNANGACAGAWNSHTCQGTREVED